MAKKIVANKIMIIMKKKQLDASESQMQLQQEVFYMLTCIQELQI